MSIVLIVIVATFEGAQGWDDIELYTESHQSWVATFLDLLRDSWLTLRHDSSEPPTAGY